MTGVFLAELLNGWLKHCQFESHCQFPISISLKEGDGDNYTVKFGEGGYFKVKGADEIIKWTYLLTALMLRFFNFKNDKEIVVFGNQMFLTLAKDSDPEIKDALIKYLNIYFDHKEDKKEIEKKKETEETKTESDRYCPKCHTKEVVFNGKRKNLNGEVQRFKCKKCDYRFTDDGEEDREKEVTIKNDS